MFENPKDLNAELLLNINSDYELKCLLDEIINFNPYIKPDPSFLKAHLMTMLRQVERYYESRKEKIQSYFMYQFVLKTLQIVDYIYSLQKSIFQENFTKSFDKQYADSINKKSDIMHEFTEIETKYQQQISELQQQLEKIQKQNTELEAECNKYRKHNEKQLDDAQANAIMEDLETAYAKIRLVINEAYDSKFKYFFYNYSGKKTNKIYE